ncbi:MAG: mercuric ion transporter MerT [Rhodoferax sp.]|nr:mercuric ion transporter MerT [Rhodoferax sp.]
MSMQKSSQGTDAKGRVALLTGGIAAILASTCCAGPLVLLMLGFSGAWIGNLTLLAPYQPVFLAAAAVALYFAWRAIWPPAAQCDTDAVCAQPRVGQAYRWLFGVVVLLVLLALVFRLIAPWLY